MKSDSEKRFDYYYLAIQKGLSYYFKKYNMNHLDYEDCFHDVMMTSEKLEQKLSSYDKKKSKGKTLVQWVVFTIIRDVLRQLGTKSYRRPESPTDFTNSLEENNVYDEVENNIEYFDYEDEKVPVFIPDMMTAKQMQNKLVTAEKLTGEKIEINITKLNFQHLRRAAWTSDELIVIENYLRLTQTNFGGLDTPLHYSFSDPMPIIKIKCWVACSKIE